MFSRLGAASACALQPTPLLCWPHTHVLGCFFRLVRLTLARTDRNKKSSAVKLTQGSPLVLLVLVLWFDIKMHADIFAC